MARKELAADLESLLRRLEERHGLPIADGRAPAMRLRESLLGVLRAYQDLHGFEQTIPTRAALGLRQGRRVREAA